MVAILAPEDWTLTTLFVDASWCPETRVGGWGAWARNGRMDRGVLYSGHFRQLVEGSNAAELLGASQALACCLRDKWVVAGDRVLFELDSQHALRVATSEERPSAGGVEVLAWRFLREKASELGLVYRVKHVKGHSNTQGTRSGVNRKVDQLAGEQMRALREHVRAGRDIGDFIFKGPATNRDRERRRRLHAGIRR